MSRPPARPPDTRLPDRQRSMGSPPWAGPEAEKAGLILLKAYFLLYELLAILSSSDSGYCLLCFHIANPKTLECISHLFLASPHAPPTLSESLQHSSLRDFLHADQWMAFRKRTFEDVTLGSQCPPGDICTPGPAWEASESCLPGLVPLVFSWDPPQCAAHSHHNH